MEEYGDVVLVSMASFHSASLLSPSFEHTYIISWDIKGRVLSFAMVYTEEAEYSKRRSLHFIIRRPTHQSRLRRELHLFRVSLIPMVLHPSN